MKAAAAGCGQSRVQLTGTGIGLRGPHISQVLATKPDIPWFEILADNHTASGGLVPRQLADIRENYPISLHCVGMSLGGIDPLDTRYLKEIRRMMISFEPTHVSDHLCFTSYANHYYHDLLPLPFTEEALWHVCDRVNQVQDALDSPLLVENVSSYLTYGHSTLSEAQFLTALSEETDCGLILDLTNAWVNQINHGESARTMMHMLPKGRVREIHLAGFLDKGQYLIDTHGSRVSDDVWDLFAEWSLCMPNVPALVEWDNDLPDLDVLLSEAAYSEQVRAKSRSRILPQQS